MFSRNENDMNAAESLHDFSLEEDTHLYRNGRGIPRPSVIEVLRSVGIFDYSRVDPEALERKRKIGSKLHRWTEYYDRQRTEPEAMLMSPEEAGYFSAWKLFRQESKIVFTEIGEPLMRAVVGVELGGRPDRVGSIQGKRCVLDLKTCTSPHPGWALQLALYEMLVTGLPRCGYLERIAVQLFPDGRYTTHSYQNSSDAGAALSIVMLAAWKQNNGLYVAARGE